MQGLARMIDAPSTGLDLLSDPFDNSQAEPADSGAMGSSLWEVETLQRHALPQVQTNNSLDWVETQLLSSKV